MSSFDGKLLSRARAALEADRENNLAEHQRRVREVYLQIPEIEQIDRRMRTQMAELVRLTLSRSSNLDTQLKALRDENLDLQIKRAELLTEHGYPVDYLDEIISCEICHDTGLANGQVCDCLRKRYNRELTRELSSLLKSGNESFENFDLSLYPSSPESGNSWSPRDAMKLVYEGCRKFAVNFPNVSTNLLLCGPTGLGKTYLSACIARVVAENGYSVCYDTASSALEAFERQKFARDPEEADAASARVRRMLSCDLMILDDLGTEMVTPMSLSALYTLINTRMNTGLRTIISTNCTDEDLDHRYTPQICSRIHGDFLKLPFSGTDIRLLKRKN